ncbi:hypothetical protein [Candidatus Pantoea floridensis]|uniref:Uncharacterized protein n=1 Tax=Candidatus Pantoea floridensis TaxID=1938870 RepID=A0A286DS91_9GAMM|nr:hypothetical protein [Pantoea floridensis]SOD61515.1 hypothetical protein SAMN06273570_5174 [Pantoea floridensis]
MYNNLYALTDSLFWSDELLKNEYADIEFTELLNELNEYNEKIDRLISDPTNDLQSSRLNVYMAGDKNIANYRSGLFSMDRVILDDVLYSLSQRHRLKLTENIIEKFIETDGNEKSVILRKEISSFIRFAKENFPLIQGEFIVFARSKSVIKESERADGILADNAESKFIYRYLPAEIARLYEKKLSVQNIERLGKSNRFRFLDKSVLANEIMIKIEDCRSPYTNGYMYQHAGKVTDNGDSIVFSDVVMGNHSGKKSYERWVQGAKNRTVLFHYRNLIADLEQAHAGRASLGTYCPFQGEVLRKLDPKDEVQRVKLSVDMPFLEGVTPGELFSIRTEFEASFNAFRAVLRDTAFDMEAESDPYRRELINKRFTERVWDEGLSDIEQKIHAYKRRSKKDLLLNVAPAVIGIIGAPSWITMTTGAISLLKGLYDINSHSAEIQSHPSYFLLKASKTKDKNN